MDDAAGEAFDKVARVLGLGYPEDRQLIVLQRKAIRCNFFPDSSQGEALRFQLQRPENSSHKLPSQSGTKM